MGRREFTKETKRKAFERSNGRCEAAGTLYGLTANTRCNADLRFGVEYDHVIPDAHSKDNSLENCAAVCIRCHRFKTRHKDIPAVAKVRRQKDRQRNITRGKQKWPKRPFRQRSAPRVRDISQD